MNLIRMPTLEAIALGWLICLSQFGLAQSTSNAGWHSFATNGFPDIFVWTDTCNVYALRDGARMNNYFDSEWDYSFGSGIYALHDAAAWLAGYKPYFLFPAHGDAIPHAKSQLESYQRMDARSDRVCSRSPRHD